MINIFSTISETIFPRYCYGCKTVMINSEEVLCANCFIELSRTFNVFEENNDLSNKVSIYFPVKNSVAFIHYYKDSLASRFIHKFKYDNDIIIGKFLTHLLCKQLEKQNWIKDIDLIVPLPLHWRRKINRGYNQAEIISREIGKEFNIEVRTNLVRRVRYNKSQTTKTKEERWKNVENIFELRNEDKLEGKHILIVDDIVTTGASLNSCIKTLSKTKDIKISVLVLASTEK